MTKTLIGWAEESLVPDKKVSLPGQFYERISEYVESEITATAMAIQSGEEKAIIISCDMTSTNGRLLQAIRENFAKMTDEVSPEYIIVGATHTHTSVGYEAGRGALSPNVAIYSEFVPE